jgi:hypothetical protein
MNEPKLRKLIENLDAEIRRTRSIAPQDRERLDRLQGVIGEYLDRSRTGGEAQPAAARNLQTALSQFESSHPALTALVAQILDDLSNIGL